MVSQVTRVARVSTKMTAAPIPKAVEVFFEVPRKGQIPRNYDKMTFLTKMFDMMMMRMKAMVCKKVRFKGIRM